MSRKTLCGLTAALLALGSLGVMGLRILALGDEVELPVGPNTWKVTMTAQGRCDGRGQVLTATPLDFNRQHVLRETYRSGTLQHKPPELRNSHRRRVLWTPHAGTPDESFKLHCEFHVALDSPNPTAPMTRLGQALYAPPEKGAWLEVEAAGSPDAERIAAAARELTAGKDGPAEQAHALFQFVDSHIANEPAVGGQGAPTTAGACLAEGSGDAGAKSRLLLALLRNRGIPSRLVAGVPLTRGDRQGAHYWVEAWLQDQWQSMCPFYHHYGKVPSTYLVFAFGGQDLVRGRHVRDLDFAFLVERYRPDAEAHAGDSALRRFFHSVSLYMLPPAEQRLVEFLLLLPLAALIVCVYRNVIGLNTFGTFAPALVGLAFRDLCTVPGLLVFAALLLVGWVFRRLLDHYHLLQVPRVSLMLSVVVTLLIGLVVAANFHAMPATHYISVFPLVIVTGMIERFWTLETEDSTLSSFKTLACTLLVAATVALALSVPVVVRHLFRFPETLGLIMAMQLLIGRYTGYRLMELYRFRDLIRNPA